MEQANYSQIHTPPGVDHHSQLSHPNSTVSKPLTEHHHDPHPHHQTTPPHPANEHNPSTTHTEQHSHIDRASSNEEIKHKRRHSKEYDLTRQTSLTDSLKRSFKQIERSRKNIYTKATPHQLGITTLLKEYIVNLCQHPQTWIEFPVQEVLATGIRKNVETTADNKFTFQLTAKEEAHSFSILNEVPELAELRDQICPQYLSDDQFWQVYFLLISNKFQLNESDDLFFMPNLQKSQNSLLYNQFAYNYGKNLDCLSEEYQIPRIRNIYFSSTTLSLELDKLKDHTSADELHLPWWHTNSTTGFRSGKYFMKFPESSSESHLSHEANKSTSSDWNRVKLNQLKLERPKIFKLLLRSGVPDSFRHKAWKSAPSSSIIRSADAHEPSTTHEDYPHILYKIFGSEVPIICNPLPTFGGNISFHQYHFLSRGGVYIVKRLITVLAMTNLQLHFAPALLDLLAILVSFMAEDDAYYVSHLLISESIHRCHYLALGNRQLELFKFTFIELFKQHLPDLFTFLDDINISPGDVFKEWISCLFVDFLPYQTVLRIIDSLLYEGSTVLYRVGLAIFSTVETQLLKMKRLDDFRLIFKRTLPTLTDASSLLTLAWSFKVKHRDLIVKYQNIVHSGKLDSVDEYETDIFHSPSLITPSSFVTPEYFDTIAKWIPSSYRLKQFERIYYSEDHGFNLVTLVSMVQDISPTLLLLKTEDQKIFGAFVNNPWKYSGTRYYGSTENFLFSIEPKVAKYSRFLPKINECFMRLNPKSVSFGAGGSGDGLRLDEELHHGQSYTCDTFKNEPLHDDQTDPEFKCVITEVYCFV